MGVQLLSDPMWYQSRRRPWASLAETDLALSLLSCRGGRDCPRPPHGLGGRGPKVTVESSAPSVIELCSLHLLVAC